MRLPCGVQASRGNPCSIDMDALRTICFRKNFNAFDMKGIYIFLKRYILLLQTQYSVFKIQYSNFKTQYSNGCTSNCRGTACPAGLFKLRMNNCVLCETFASLAVKN